MTKMDKEYIEREYEQAIKEYNTALTEDDMDNARRTMKRLEAIAMQDYFLQSSLFFSFYINSIINGHIKICKSFINNVFSKIDVSSRTILIFV